MTRRAPVYCGNCHAEARGHARVEGVRETVFGEVLDCLSEYECGSCGLKWEVARKPTPREAIQAARSEFGRVYQIPGSRLWTYETVASGALQSASRNYWAIVHMRTREVVVVAHRLLGWTVPEARAYAKTHDGRGTYRELVMRGIEWRAARKKEEKRNVA